MTGKERMITALRRGKPDHLPVTIHQWQAYHLEHFMGGVDQIAAFAAVGLDSSVTPLDVGIGTSSPRWRTSTVQIGRQHDETFYEHRVETPDGTLVSRSASNAYTSYTTQYPIKTRADAEIFLGHWSPDKLDRQRLSQWYDRTGDAGIVRGFVCMAGQPGPWQDFCSLVGTQTAILWAIDEPAFVHHFLSQITKWKVRYVHEEMRGAKYDLIEHGGGAASSTVISPAMFDEFCVPYDRQIIGALHEEGFPVVYHTCGGMMSILDRIANNDCDASETLSPVGVGGDIKDHDDRLRLKRTLGGRVALIGGIDQGELLTNGSERQIAAAVRECFETFGLDGGYLCSASDHFFHAPGANLKAMARAAAECRY